MKLNNAYVDINVILDLMLKREPNWNHIAELFQYAKRGKIRLFTSPISFDTLYYILKRSGLSDQVSRRKLKMLLHFVGPTSINKAIIQDALSDKYRDFEDGIHIRCAEVAELDIIVTSNTKDFKAATIGTYDPPTLLKLINQ